MIGYSNLNTDLCLVIVTSILTCDWCRSAQVCRAWYVLALDGSNWQRVDLFQFQVDIEGAVVENLAKKCGGFLKSLSLNGCQVSKYIVLGYRPSIQMV